MSAVQQSKGTRRSRSFDLESIRKSVRETLKRAELKIEKNVTGEKSGDPEHGPMPNKLFSYLLSGDRVSDSTGRYYMNNRLARLSDELGVHVELRRVKRGSTEVYLDVFPSKDDADEARKVEDVRKASQPGSSAKKYYYRNKAGLTGQGSLPTT